MMTNSNFSDWQGIRGHADVFTAFDCNLRRGRLASTYLFVGPPGIGKRMSAIAIAKSLLCERRREPELTVCGTCSSCLQIDASVHQDLEIISKPADKTMIPIDLFIGDRENRNKVGLCHNLGLKPFRGGRKIAIIDDADHLNVEGANCLLKTLEEPPPKSVLILIGTSEQRQLPTIRSRCQIVRFQPLPTPILRDLILQLGLATDPSSAQQLAMLADGSLQHAQDYADPAMHEFRERLLKELAKGDFWSPEMLKFVAVFVEGAGTEAVLRRSRLRAAIGFALQFYRELLRANCGTKGALDEQLLLAVELAQKCWTGGPESIARCIERSMDCLAHVDASAHVSSVSDLWLDEISTLSCG